MKHTAPTSGDVKSPEKLRTSAVIIITLSVCCIIMAVVDGVISPPYAVKSAVKVLLFVLIPGVSVLILRDKSLLTVFRPKPKALIVPLITGVVLYFLITGAFFVLRDTFDFSSVVSSLSDIGVNRGNFIYVSLYISFVNSFLEEAIFRGYGFLYLSRFTGRLPACLVSGALFALYHIAIMSGWYSPLLTVLLIAALFAGGVILNLFNTASGTLYPSWILHIFANFAINTIGMILFGIIPV